MSQLEWLEIEVLNQLIAKRRNGKKTRTKDWPSYKEKVWIFEVLLALNHPEDLKYESSFVFKQTFMNCHKFSSISCFDFNLNIFLKIEIRPKEQSLSTKSSYSVTLGQNYPHTIEILCDFFYWDPKKFPFRDLRIISWIETQGI